MQFDKDLKEVLSWLIHLENKVLLNERGYTLSSNHLSV
jgi:hypothetical protein